MAWKNDRIVVYQIVNVKNENKYIGSGLIRARWNSHKKLLIGNKHSNSHLQAAWNKWGEESFRFDIIQETSTFDEARKIEQELLDCYKQGSWDELYNIAESVYTPAIGEEVRRKMSDAAKRRAPITEETRTRISEAGKGRVFSEESIEKIRQAHLGQKRSDEVRRKMSEAKKGKKQSEDRKKKTSEVMKQWWADRKAAQQING